MKKKRTRQAHLHHTSTQLKLMFTSRDDNKQSRLYEWFHWMYSKLRHTAPTRSQNKAVDLLLPRQATKCNTNKPNMETCATLWQKKGEQCNGQTSENINRNRKWKQYKKMTARLEMPGQRTKSKKCTTPSWTQKKLHHKREGIKTNRRTLSK